ncbi:MAG TPA: RNA methyltransferase [Bacillota bacterium]|nr:RNA methyltransferase [Bacillota bacterium]
MLRKGDGILASPTVYIALLHYPVYNKHMEVITTSITNLDVHDISRSARTYNVAGYYIVHPIKAQQELIGHMLEYWQSGFGSQYNPDRKEAFERLKLVDTLEDTLKDIEAKTGKRPITITTDARTYPNTISYHKLREEMEQEERPYLIMFGTGYGMEQQTMELADYILEPIYGGGEYNHLSVRSAVAIILDRVLGEQWWRQE